VVAGDWYDMPSLSAWDSAAKKVAEKRFYKSTDSMGDVEAGTHAMKEFLKPIKKKRGYMPIMHFLMGNHEHRITRYQAEHPELGNDTVSLDHLYLDDFHVHQFLDPIEIDGVLYCHYFCVDANGRVMNSKRGQGSAKAQVNNVGCSATAGHKQGLDTYIKECQGGRKRGLIAGSFYQHDEEYLGPQGNDHWSGIIFKHEVCDGDYDCLEVSLGFLLRRYA